MGTPFVGTVAARSYLLASGGDLDGAFYLLCCAAQANPGKRWAAGWLAAPGAEPGVREDVAHIVGAVRRRPGSKPAARRDDRGSRSLTWY